MTTIDNNPFVALSTKERRGLLMGLLECYVIESKEYQTEIEFVHDHLPRLEACGYISWDKEKEIIERGEKWNEIEPYLHKLKGK